jgi:hypothetical protein
MNPLRIFALLLLSVLSSPLFAAGSLPSATPLTNPKITGSGGTIESGATVTNSGTLIGAGVFNFSGGTLTLADNQVPWAKVNKSGSALSDLSGTLGIAGGGTGGSTAIAALDALITAEASVASAATTDLGAVTSRNVSITGTTTITSFGVINAGVMRWGRFTGALTLTHNATSLILPSGASITTAANDRFVAVSLASGNWLVYSYTRADGSALVGAATAAPTDATYIVQTANGTLSAEQAMGALATGIVKNTTTTGVQSIAVAGTDYLGVPGSSAEGDLLYRDGSGWTRLAKGTALHGLRVNAAGTALEYAAISGSGGGTKTLARFTATDNQPPSATYARYDTRNSIALLNFSASGSERAVFVGVIPEAASFTTGITVRLFWMAGTATSGNVMWTVAFERGTTDLDSDSFATGLDSTSDATNGTSGIVTVSSIDFNGTTEIDSLVAGDEFRVAVNRKTAGVSGNMSGEAQLIAVEIRQR